MQPSEHAKLAEWCYVQSKCGLQQATNSEGQLELEAKDALSRARHGQNLPSNRDVRY